MVFQAAGGLPLAPSTAAPVTSSWSGGLGGGAMTVHMILGVGSATKEIGSRRSKSIQTQNRSASATAAVSGHGDTVLDELWAVLMVICITIDRVSWAGTQTDGCWVLNAPDLSVYSYCCVLPVF